jgi:RNA polymerase sigma-70 factor (ECF subfamily)
MNNEISTVQAILDGDTEKYAELMDGCASHVIKLVSRRIPASDVEMVVQESFVRAYDSLKSYSGRSPFINWMSRIAIRSCCDYWRRNEKHKKLVYALPDKSYQEWLEAVSSSGSVERFEQLAAEHECRELLNLALAHLSPEERVLIEMIYFEGWPLHEAAVTLNWGLAMTKVRAMRTRRKMRKIIESLQEKYHG